MPDYLQKTSLEDVSHELAINDRDTLESLSEKRRASPGSITPTQSPLPFARTPICA